MVAPFEKKVEAVLLGGSTGSSTNSCPMYGELAPMPALQMNKSLGSTTFLIPSNRATLADPQNESAAETHFSSRSSCPISAILGQGFDQSSFKGPMFSFEA